MKPELKWKERPIWFAFWAINIGLMLEILLSLLPVGLMQTYQSVSVGYWSARSSEFMQTDLMQTLRWLRMIGDTVFAFDVQNDGTVKNQRPFAKIHDVKPGEESGADGLAIDRAGHLYFTSSTGVQVFDRKGQYLGTIKVARQPANLAFAGPGKRTLYITAREGLYRVQTLAQGPNRLGK